MRLEESRPASEAPFSTRRMADETTGWPSSADQYQLESRIGQGAFSEVWKAHCRPRNTPVAVKVMDLENINSSFEDITQEVSFEQQPEDDSSRVSRL